MEKLFGTSIMMGNQQFLRIRMYENRNTQIILVAHCVNLNCYFRLKVNFHVNSQQQAPEEETCLFWKVAPLEQYNSIGEQMIPFTGIMPTKQLIKTKPNPVGLKNFAMYGNSGRSHDFELYQGKGTGTSAGHKYLGLGVSIVMRLAEGTPKHDKFKLFFDDNYFTSMGLIKYMKANLILALCVLKSNRMEGCVLKIEKELREEGRGSSDTRVSQNGDIPVIRWLDNEIVNLAQSFVGAGNPDATKKWSISEKQHMKVAPPDDSKDVQRLYEQR